jgi:hypothetical protein
MSSLYIENLLWNEFTRSLREHGLTIHADGAALVREVIEGMVQHLHRGSELAMSEARAKMVRLALRMKEWADSNATTEVTPIGFHHSRPLTGRFKPFNPDG